MKHRITSNATTNVKNATCYLSQFVIAVENAGSAWTLKIQDKAGSPAIIFQVTTLTVPSDGKPIIVTFDNPILMEGGVDAVTAGTTPGAVAVWFNFDKGRQ